MKNIIPSGAFFPKNKSGELLNPCSLDLIDSSYLPLLKEITQAYIAQEEANLHSVYLRGSVPRGMAMEDSDLDTFALILTETDRWKKPVWAKEYQVRWKKDYPFVPEVELYVASYAPVIRSVDVGIDDAEEERQSFSERGLGLPSLHKVGTAFRGRGQLRQKSTILLNPNLAMIIKTQSICLHGEDIGSKIPGYLPDVSMMLSHPWLAEDLADFNKHKNDPIKVRGPLKALLKTLIRSGFELVMPKIQQYTPDLYLCYRSFSDFYPKQEEGMQTALSAYLNLEEVKIANLDEMLNDLGNWMIAKFEKEI